MADIALGAAPPAPERRWKWLGLAVVAATSLACLYAVWTLYLLGQVLLAVFVLALVAGFAIVFSNRRFYASRFIYAGLATIILFSAFPVIYTIYIGFTNYSFLNLLTFERAREVLLSRALVDPDSERPFGLVADGDGYRIFLPAGEGGLLSEPLPLDGEAVEVPAVEVASAPETLAMREVVQHRDALGKVTVVLPDGTGLVQSGLRNFAAVTPEYELEDDGRLVSNVDGSVLTPDHEVGFYRDQTGQTVPPGWRVFIGLENFDRVFNSAGIRQPMLSIFVWTVSFALLSVGLTFALGLLLAAVLQWPHLRYKPLYRLLLILP